VVVQFAGDALAFVFLGHDQLLGQGAHLFLGPSLGHDAADLVGYGVDEAAFLAQKRTLIAVRTFLQIADFDRAAFVCVDDDGTGLAPSGAREVAGVVPRVAKADGGTGDVRILPGRADQVGDACQELIQRLFAMLGQPADAVEAIEFFYAFKQIVLSLAALGHEYHPLFFRGGKFFGAVGADGHERFSWATGALAV
jgi:hypothetical protein